MVRFPMYRPRNERRGSRLKNVGGLRTNAGHDEIHTRP
jgi:hypothetical protein